MVNPYIAQGSLRRLSVASVALDHPEGVTVGLDGSWYAGSESGLIYRVNPSTGAAAVVAKLNDYFISGLCVDGHGLLYVCASIYVYQINTLSGVAKVYSSGHSNGDYVAPNWPTFDQDGLIWLTDSGDELSEEPTGAVYVIPAGGGPGQKVDCRPLAYPNMSAMTFDGELIFAETRACQVTGLRAGGATRVIAEFPDCVVDGVALTRGGGVVVSHFQPNQIDYVSEGGDISTIVSDKSGLRMLTPTSVAFWGPAMSDLLVSSYGNVYLQTLPTQLTGQPLFYPRQGLLNIITDMPEREPM